MRLRRINWLEEEAGKEKLYKAEAVEDELVDAR